MCKSQFLKYFSEESCKSCSSIKKSDKCVEFDECSSHSYEYFKAGYESALSQLNLNENKQYPVGVVGKNIQDSIELAKLNGLKPHDTRECVLLYRPEHFCSWIFSKIITNHGVELDCKMQNALDIALGSQLERPKRY